MSKRLPLFIGIGAAHAGMGEVVNWLSEHPAIADKIPALNFFQQVTAETKGVTWYEAQLTGHTSSVHLYGDCSAGYLISPHVPEQIVKLYPDAKLFVILRHPVRRALAEYVARQKTDRTATTQSAYAYLVQHSELLTYGQYAKHLDAYFAYYSPLQLQVIFYEDMIAAPLATYEAMCKFLEVDHTFIPKALRPFAPPPEEPKHPSLIWRARHGIKKLHKRFFVKEAGPLFPDEKTYNNLISVKEWQDLEKAFVPDTEVLSHLLKRDMSVYWKYHGTEDTED